MSTPFYKLSPGGIDTVGLGLRSPAGVLFPITGGVAGDLDASGQAGAMHLTAEGPLVLLDGVPSAVMVEGQDIDMGAGELSVDVINESTAAAGVTIDGTLVKDGGLSTADAGTVTTNTIAEKTAASGVTVDGCLIKDGRAAALATAGMILSSEITGNGGAQNFAHGFGAAPTIAVVIPTELTGGAYDASWTSDATNVAVTVTTGEKYRVLAFK